MVQAVEVNSWRFGPMLKDVGQKQAVGVGGMVATAFPAATEAAVEILQAGGNAIDAAVAAAWALAVCEPSCSGLGGQTTILIRLASGKMVVVDGHSYAPAAVSRKRVSKQQQQKGYRACNIPSTPATLGFAQKRYGVLDHARVMEPAIHLAEDGYVVTRLQRHQLNWCLTDLLASPAAAAIFLKNGRPFEVGDVFRQKDLAATLRCLSDRGTTDFYQGRVARAIVEDMKKHGGLITEQDLAGCTVPVESEVVSINYRGYQVLTVPPPAGGLQVLLALKILEHFEPSELSANPDRWYEVLAEVTRAVFRERQRSPVHPRNSAQRLYNWLLNNERASGIANSIKGCCREDVSESSEEEPGETTHLCTADAQGNAVTLTQSIQSLFGAKVANAKLAFLYNNYLCTCPRRRHPYQLGSQCIPLSNIAPTLVLRSGLSGAEKSGSCRRRHKATPFLALGAAGSRRIMSAILHVISGVIDREMSLAEAVACPRVHALLSRNVLVERSAINDSLRLRLEKRFRKVETKAPDSYSMGAVQAIQFREDGTLIGAADPRRDGTAVALR